MPLLTQLLIAILPVLILSTGTAIYLNRRKSDRIYQRLFGLEDDPADKGYIPEMDAKVETINQNVKELNHQRINDIEKQLDGVQSSIENLQTRMDTQEDDEP